MFFLLQFLNQSASPESSDCDSLPMSSQKPLLATPLHRDHTPRPQKKNDMFRTPTIRRSLLELSPRTPTPFRSSMVECIKQEPMECVVSVGSSPDQQPTLKKIKQEVESPCLQWKGSDLPAQLFSPSGPAQEVPVSYMTATTKSSLHVFSFFRRIEEEKYRL
uniref:C-myb C-terminal domain-containing protein n=1 Tax=Hucho hucho TaxID=62062 RepID=A0A4W5L8J9_9TELE